MRLSAPSSVAQRARCLAGFPDCRPVADRHTRAKGASLSLFHAIRATGPGGVFVSATHMFASHKPAYRPAGVGAPAVEGRD
jgi:hypothetical protein